MKILITGGAGYIGSHITEELLKKHEIVIVDNLSTGFKSLLPKSVKFFQINIKDTLKLKEIIIREKIQIVIHLAAKLSLQEAQSKPKKYFENNVNGTKSLLNAIEHSNVKTFIFSSTAAVYSGNNTVECKETLKPKPNNLYGKTKFLGEKLIKQFCKRRKIKFFILRYFNVVGASKSGKIGPLKNYGQLFKVLSKKSLQKYPKINIYGINHLTPDGTCVRDFIDINDLVNIHKFLITNLNKFKYSKILNCGYGKGYSVLEVVKTFEKVVKKKINIKFLKKRKKEVSNIFANNSVIKDNIKWKPKYHNLILTIKRSLKWEKKISNV